MINNVLQYRIILCVFLALAPQLAAAQSSSISVTPTIHEMFVTPGQNWQSAIKVTNHNQQPITVYTEPMLFSPRGERGHSAFTAIDEARETSVTLAEWMTVATSGTQIAPESSVSIPVQVAIPQDASPGGHYAALLIGTRPPEGEGIQVATAQIISSLFFVRVEGDVDEAGMIRSFRPADKIVETPSAEFLVRFQNTGNVHLQPQGEIVITNMWGKERGAIPVNQRTNFGNVLPESVREFAFDWTGDRSLVDIGRYTATLTLGYGTEQKKFVTMRSHFWVVPIVPLLITLSVIFASIWFLSWCIRAYIRRALASAGVVHQRPEHAEAKTRTLTFRVLRSPLEDGVIDLRSQLQHTSTYREWLSSLATFVLQRRLFFAAVFVVFAVCALTVWYFTAVLVPARNYDVTVHTNGQATQLDSEEILYQKSASAERGSKKPVINNDYDIRITNTTDTPGRAVGVAEALEEAGYTIAAVDSDITQSREHTVIVYSQALAEDALALSQLLENALLSAAPSDANASPYIHIYIGEQ